MKPKLYGRLHPDLGILVLKRRPPTVTPGLGRAPRTGCIFGLSGEAATQVVMAWLGCCITSTGASLALPPTATRRDTQRFEAPLSLSTLEGLAANRSAVRLRGRQVAHSARTK